MIFVRESEEKIIEAVGIVNHFRIKSALSLQEILSKTIPGYPLESLAFREAFIFYPNLAFYRFINRAAYDHIRAPTYVFGQPSQIQSVHTASSPMDFHDPR